MAVAFRLTVNAREAGRQGIAAARRKVLEATRQVLNRATVGTPVKTGNLRRNNQMRVARDGPTRILGEVYNPASYAKAVHEGSGLYGPSGQPYIIRPRRKKALRFVVAGETFIVKSVSHPGSPGQPWLLRALEQVAPRYGFVITRL